MNPMLKLADFGPDSGGRVKVCLVMFVLFILFISVIITDYMYQGVTEVKPIVYGNFSRAFGKKREEDGHTHQW